jgi:glycosyltransferase involved in cell wall biosynthesis
MPKTALDAMSCGKAIVVSDIPQNREGAIHGDEMFFVPPCDIKAISDAINRLLIDQELRHQMDVNSKRTIEEYYTP